MAAIIIAVMFPDLTSVHVKEDFDSAMISRRVWVSLLDKLAYRYSDVLFILVPSQFDLLRKDTFEDMFSCLLTYADLMPWSRFPSLFSLC